MKSLYLLLPLLLQACLVQQKPSELKFSDTVYRELASSSENFSLVAKTVDRRYVNSVLTQVFDIPPNETTSIVGVYQRKEFGGACDRYAPFDNGSTYEYPLEQCYSGVVPYLPAHSNPARYSYTMKVCNTLINTLDRFTAIMKKVYPTWAGGNATLPSPTATDISVIYGLFHQSETIEPDVLNAFLELSSKSSNTRDAWRSIVTTLCVDPSWQGF